MPYFRLKIPIYDISSTQIDLAHHSYFSIGRWYMIWEWSETAFSVSSPTNSWSDFLILPVVFGSILHVSISSSKKHLGVRVCRDSGFDCVSSIINYENRHFHQEEKKKFWVSFNVLMNRGKFKCKYSNKQQGFVRYKLLCFFFFCCCFFDFLLNNTWFHNLIFVMRLLRFFYLGCVLLDTIRDLFVIRTIIVQ